MLYIDPWINEAAPLIGGVPSKRGESQLDTRGFITPGVPFMPI